MAEVGPLPAIYLEFESSALRVQLDVCHRQSGRSQRRERGGDLAENPARGGAAAAFYNGSQYVTSCCSVILLVISFLGTHPAS